jgi:glycosyltransferase involved in cell wall biosynthesis
MTDCDEAMRHDVLNMNHVFAIPAYGRSPYLESCIVSILNQSQGAPRIVLGTSTPSDDLAALAARHRLTLHVNPERRGIAADWNYVLRLADADYVTIAHQDDVYDSEYLFRLAQVAARHADLILAFSDFSEHTDLGKRAPNINVRVKRWLCGRVFGNAETIESKAQKRRLLQLGNPICCPSVMLHWREIKNFEFSAAFRTNLDWEAWLRLAELPGSFAYLREALVSKGIHPASETTLSIANRARQIEDLAMFRRFWPRPIASLIAAAYSLGYRANRVGTDG